MPNHVKNVIKSTNKELLSLLEDFNQIIPRPSVMDRFGELIPYIKDLPAFIEVLSGQEVLIWNQLK